MHLVPVVAVQRVYVQAPPGHARQQPAGRQKHEAAADKGKSDLGAEEGGAEQAAKKKENEESEKRDAPANAEAEAEAPPKKKAKVLPQGVLLTPRCSLLSLPLKS